MINEGAIIIDSEDKKAILSYINDMTIGVNNEIAKKGYILDTEVENIIQTVSDNLNSNKFPFNIEYASAEGLTKGWYSKHSNTIGISIDPVCKWNIGSIDGKKIYKCVSVNFKKIASAFVHEFVHYIQNIYRQEKSGDYNVPRNWNDLKKYYKRGWEQQAHALGYLEKMRSELNIKKPEELRNNLKKYGVLHNKDLHALKTSDYKSWKAIMKQAIMSAIADIKDKNVD
jgi:hypothetical protein